MDCYQDKVSSVVALLKDVKIVPVLAIEKVEDGIKVCELLNKCGLKAAEITRLTLSIGIIYKRSSLLLR